MFRIIYSKRETEMSLRFSTRQHICLAHYILSQRWISQKPLKLWSCNFHHTVAPYI